MMVRGLFLSEKSNFIHACRKDTVYKAFKKAGIKDVNYKFYSGARHEILNDFYKDTVYKDILEWINNHV